MKLQFFLFGLVFFGMTSCATQSSQVDGQQTALMKLGDAAVESGNYDQAENLYRSVHLLNPKKDAPLIKLAEVQTKEGKFSDALDTYNQIRVMKPSNFEIKYKIQYGALFVNFPGRIQKFSTNQEIRERFWIVFFEIIINIYVKF